MQKIQLCAVCFCCGSFNLFYFINLVVAGYYLLYLVLFFNIKCSVLNESQRALKRLVFVLYLSFVICIKNNTKTQGEGLCAVKDP